MSKNIAMIDTSDYDFEEAVNIVATDTTENVYSDTRNIKQGDIVLPRGIRLNTKIKMEGLKFLKKLESNVFPIVFCSTI